MKKWSVIFLVITVIVGAIFINQTSINEEATYLVQTFEYHPENSVQRFKYYDEDGKLLIEHFEKNNVNALITSIINPNKNTIYQYDNEYIFETDIEKYKTKVYRISMTGDESLDDVAFDEEGNRYDLKSLRIVGGTPLSTVYKNNEKLFSISKSYKQLEYHQGYFYLLFDVLDPVVEVYDEKGELQKTFNGTSVIKLNNSIYAVADLGHTLNNLNTDETLFSNQPILDSPIIKTSNNQTFLTYPNSNIIYKLNIKNNQISFETLYSKENSKVEMSFVNNEWIVYQRDNFNNQMILDIIDENGFKEQKKMVIELEKNELITHVYKLR